MSMHPSLAATDKGKKQRSVLKRIERIKTMMEKEQWKEGDKVYGLPKIKTIRIKIKKEKAEKALETTAAEGAVSAPGASAPAKEAQPQAGAETKKK